MPIICTNEREKFNMATCERYAPHFHSDRSTCQKDDKPQRPPAYYLAAGAREENYQLNLIYRTLMDQAAGQQDGQDRPNFFPMNFLETSSTKMRTKEEDLFSRGAIYCQK